MTDRHIPLIVVVTLALVVLTGEISMAYLAFTGTGIPDQLDRIVTLAIGALAAILATTRANGDPVAVAGVDGGPVETVDVADDTPPKK